MRRREFIAALSGAAAWPLVARAQHTPVIAFLGAGKPPENMIEAFRRGLDEVGHDQSFAVEFHSGDYALFSALAAELVNKNVDVILAIGGTSAAIAARSATSTIPIIFYIGGDPIAYGLIDNFSRPGGNATGVANVGTELGSKRLELLRNLLPDASSIGMLVNRSTPDSSSEIRDIESAANDLGRQVHILSANAESDFDRVFAELARRKIAALIVGSDAFFTVRRARLVELANRHRLPTIYDRRDFVVAGGLISYGHNRVDAYRQLGVYAGRILNGAKPADLPVVQPTRFELVINLTTAKALGLTIPERILALADEVID